MLFFSIHPRDKQDVAQRLFMSGLQVAYHKGSAAVEGPRPVDIVQQGSFVTLNYAAGDDDTKIQLASREGFEVSSPSPFFFVLVITVTLGGCTEYKKKKAVGLFTVGDHCQNCLPFCHFGG